MKTAFFLVCTFFCAICSAQTFNCNDTWYEGEGTHYGGFVGGGNGGNCGIPVDSGDIYHAAMNYTQYDSSNACGACVRILGPKGEAILKIVDKCPECKFGDIDMTTAVFPQLADMKDGRIKIRWQYVPCPQAKGIKFVFAPGSGPYYFKAQVRDFYYPINKLEYKKSDGSYDTIHREVYNYFVRQGGIDDDKTKTGPYTFRLTSITGQVVDIPNIPFSTTETITTPYQFADIQCPDCAGVKNGTAKRDNCDVCSGGNTGIEPNSTCQKDCNGYWEQTGYIDDCGKCVAGTTGATPCGNDCNGQPGGGAFPDKCGVCVSGTTGKIACKKDCNNEWGGSAFRDSCKTCAGGNTGINPILSKQNCGITAIGHEQETTNSQLKVYPNPFADDLFFTETLSDIALKDVWGITVFVSAEKLKQFNTESIVKGFYFLEGKIENGILIIRKVVKQ